MVYTCQTGGLLALLWQLVRSLPTVLQQLSVLLGACIVVWQQWQMASLLLPPVLQEISQEDGLQRAAQLVQAYLESVYGERNEARQNGGKLCLD